MSNEETKQITVSGIHVIGKLAKVNRAYTLRVLMGVIIIALRVGDEATARAIWSFAFKGLSFSSTGVFEGKALSRGVKAVPDRVGLDEDCRRLLGMIHYAQSALTDEDRRNVDMIAYAIINPDGPVTEDNVVPRVLYDILQGEDFVPRTKDGTSSRG